MRKLVLKKAVKRTPRTFYFVDGKGDLYQTAMKSPGRKVAKKKTVKKASKKKRARK